MPNLSEINESCLIRGRLGVGRGKFCWVSCFVVEFEMDFVGRKMNFQWEIDSIFLLWRPVCVAFIA